MAYRIELSPKAERDFKALDGSVRGRIKRRIDSLAENPYPSGISKIEGEDDLCRLRVGDYRILYQVKKKILLILIVGIRAQTRSLSTTRQLEGQTVLQPERHN